MQIKIFDILASASEQDVEIVNKFIRGHKVVDIDKQFYVSSDNVAHWSLCITYLAMAYQQQNNQPEKREKVDYKNVLSADDFEKFTKLRIIRKKLAEDNAIPAYAVFTDSELAQIAQLPSVDARLLKQITGIGDKRVEKYGNLICEIYKETTE
ncbi:MAG: HRDC domain-containing protein [Bacteroidaceae bacterium]|nr:HRDC domain-containing protein [Bacteroidaceae bacterium]